MTWTHESEAQKTLTNPTRALHPLQKKKQKKTALHDLREPHFQVGKPDLRIYPEVTEVECWREGAGGGLWCCETPPPLHHGANMTCLSTSPFSTSLSISPHLIFILLPPLRSKWRTLPPRPLAVPLPPPPLRPPLTSRSLLHCCAPPLPQLHRASSASLHRCRRVLFRTERPTTTLRLRSSGQLWPPHPLGAPTSGLHLPTPPPLQGRCLHRWLGSKSSSPTRTDTHR